MRKLAAVILLLCLLAGCSEQNQVENLAYAILFGIDLAGDGICVTVQVPEISGGEEDAKSLVYSAEGSDFDGALNALNWAVPRKLDLSQIKLVIVSEALARSDQFAEVTDAIMNTPRFYTAARLAVCEGDAAAFIAAQDATDLTAMFEDYTHRGLIPDVQFADSYYKSVSIYSDPLAIYTRADAESASLIVPDAEDRILLPDDNRFLGAAAFRDRKMVGVLDARQLLCCKLLRGKDQTFSVRCGDAAVQLANSGSPEISIDTTAEPIQIRVALRLTVLPSGADAPGAEITALMEDALAGTIAECKAMGIEPFQFAEIAARKFATIGDWLDYDWQTRFADSDVQVHVELVREDL